MAKGKRKHRRPGRAPLTAEQAVTELDARIDEIARAEPGAEGPIWGAAHKLLLKTSADAAEVGRVIARRDLPALRRLVRTLAGDETPAEDAHATPVEATAPRAVPPEVLKKALRAFRKRMKLIRLDHESRLGVGPMTGGRKADFQAILPPQEFPPEVWEALAAAGRLRPAGQGFYMLAEGESGEHAPP